LHLLSDFLVFKVCFLKFNLDCYNEGEFSELDEEDELFQDEFEAALEFEGEEGEEEDFFQEEDEFEEEEEAEEEGAEEEEEEEEEDEDEFDDEEEEEDDVVSVQFRAFKHSTSPLRTAAEEAVAAAAEALTEAEGARAAEAAVLAKIQAIKPLREEYEPKGLLREKKIYCEMFCS
jgi:hypothetical protein